MNKTICIEVSELSAGYNAPILSDISFSVSQASSTVIIGRSGCGKSTLLKTMIGLIPPLAGRINFFGKNLASLGEAQRPDFYKKLGVLYQNSALLNSMDIRENVSLPVRLHYPDTPGDVIEEMVRLRLSQVGLNHVEDLYPSQLSGGMRKRAGLARALILDPEIIFCDEPSAGLDPVTSVGIDRLILSLRDQLGVTFIVVTHELASIREIADQIVFLHQGRLIFNGDLAAMAGSDLPAVTDFMSRKNQDAYT